MRNAISRGFLAFAAPVATIAVFTAATLVTPALIQAQTFSVIHSFNGLDGANPWAGLARDKSGNLYGTTFAGGRGNCMTAYGQTGCGTVFQLSKAGAGWALNPLYSFAGGNDGAGPQLGSLTVAANGTIFGTTVVGGGGSCSSYDLSGCGTVFHLTVPPTICKTAFCPWRESVIYRFQNNGDGAYPHGGPIFDNAGNLYGTAGDYPSYGDIYQLAPSGSSWVFSVAYAFQGNDGQIPEGQLIFDSNGNIDGTTWAGGADSGGTVFQLTHSGSGWTQSHVYSFTGGTDGRNPTAGVVLDPLGNLYGATIYGGENGSGAAFELSPNSWNVTTSYDFSGTCSGTSAPPGVAGELAIDGAGNLYGTTTCGGMYGYGTVFRLAPTQNGWAYTDLHDFSDQNGDGAYPFSNVVLDPDTGNLYGTSYAGGVTNSRCDQAQWAGQCGVVWQITPQ